MRRYETISILRPNAAEEEITRVINSTTEIITDQGGSVIELNKWGMKKLAYLIKKESLGYYVYFDYAGTPAAVSEIERKFRIDDTVLKYMTIKTAAAITDEEIQQAITAASEKPAAPSEGEDDEPDEGEMAAEEDSEEETEED